jgi:hypothetical protein
MNSEGVYKVAGGGGGVNFRSSLSKPLSREAETLTSFGTFGGAGSE